MFKYIICVMLMFPSISFADGELLLDVNLTSWHAKSGYTDNGKYVKYNNKNVGLGLTYVLNKNTELKAGWFDNSYYTTSFYAGVNFKYSHKYIAPGILIGFVTGYDNTPRNLEKVAILFLPNIIFNLSEKHSIVIGGVPEILGNGGFATLQYRYRL